MYLLKLKDISRKDTNIAGGKGASLGEMYNNKINVPNAFVITSNAFSYHLETCELKNKINELINNLKKESEEEIEEISKKIQEAIMNSNLSQELEEEIYKAYKKLDCKYVAVRSSATAEDGKSSAWAGQLESYLNTTKENLILNVKKCWASLYSKRALFYRLKKEEEKDVTVAVVIQEMIQSKVSGIAFSKDPVANNNNIVIEAVFGLGETVVSGRVTPDNYIVDKQKEKILQKSINFQDVILTKESGYQHLQEFEKQEQKLSNEKIIELAKQIKKIEEHYGFPVDIEWAIEEDQIYILQCRPITTLKKDPVQEVLNQIKEKNNFIYLVRTPFNYFFEKIRIELKTKERGLKNFLIVDWEEYCLKEDLENYYARIKREFRQNQNYFYEFKDRVIQLMDDAIPYIQELKSKDFLSLTKEQLLTYLDKFYEMYYLSLVLCGCDFDKLLEEHFISELKKLRNFTQEEIEEISENINTCPDYRPIAYSEEPLELLEIALNIKRREETIKSLSEKTSKEIDKHIQKYAWIKTPLSYITVDFTRKDYLDRIEFLLKEDIEKRKKDILEARQTNKRNYLKTIERYQIKGTSYLLAEAIRIYIFTRSYIAEKSDYLFYVGKNTVLKEISKRCGLTIDEIVMLDKDEMVESIKDETKIEEMKKRIKLRNDNFSIISLDNEISIFLGEDSKRLAREVARRYKSNEQGKEVIEAKTDYIKGICANKGYVEASVKVLLSPEDIHKVKKGDIIVASMTTPDYVSAMEKASGFITNSGGVTCHAAIISREFGVPCIVGTKNATKLLKDGDNVILDATNGEVKIRK